MRQCRNDCGIEISDNLQFCSKECAKEYKEKIESRQESSKTKCKDGNNNEIIERILGFIGVTHDNARSDAYNHWLRFIEFCKRNSGRNWKDDIRPKLRSWIAVDFRYIDDYLDSCISWNIIDLENGILVFKGLPEKEVSP